MKPEQSENWALPAIDCCYGNFSPGSRAEKQYGGHDNNYTYQSLRDLVVFGKVICLINNSVAEIGETLTD